MQPYYTLRRAAVDDAVTITHHRRRMFEDMNSTDYTQVAGFDDVYTTWVRRVLAEDRYVGWLVMADTVIVGGAGIQLHEQQPHPLDFSTVRAHVVNVYIEPEHRRRGLARGLMQAVLAWCEDERIRVMTLQASDEARSLYESLGFRATNAMIRVR